MAKLIIPSDYDPKMTIRETEKAIRYIRETFQTEFGTAMNLERISAPMFVKKSSGLNDNLSGWEKPVSFTLHDGNEGELQIVHSLAGKMSGGLDLLRRLLEQIQKEADRIASHVVNAAA